MYDPETEREARKDLYNRLQALESAERDQGKAHAVLEDAQEAANAADTKVAEKRAAWESAWGLYQAASTAVPDDLAGLE